MICCLKVKVMGRGYEKKPEALIWGLLAKVMLGHDLDRRGPKDFENDPNSFLTKTNGRGFWRFGADLCTYTATVIPWMSYLSIEFKLKTSTLLSDPSSIMSFSQTEALSKTTPASRKHTSFSPGLSLNKDLRASRLTYNQTTGVLTTIPSIPQEHLTKRNYIHSRRKK